MTGFARAEGADEYYSWAWEAKSVNGKALDIRCRLPAGFDRLEMAARRATEATVSRGNLTLSLTVTGQGLPASYQINRDLLTQVLALQAELGDQVASDTPRLEGLLAIRGMIEPIDGAEAKDVVDTRDQQILATLDEALAALSLARIAEGSRLAPTIEALLDQIGQHVDRAVGCAAAQADAIGEKIKATIAELIEATEGAAGKVPHDRLAQEVALAAGRADVREEIDRLAAHLASARDLLGESGPVGRRLDFLCQEFNREANTLCSKAADLELHGAGLALKAAVEQLREQVQNIE